LKLKPTLVRKALSPVTSKEVELGPMAKGSIVKEVKEEET
jgi:hypothetical protein